MKKITFLLMSLFLLNVSSVFGQSHPNSILIRKGLGIAFFQNDKKLTPKQLLEVTKTDSEAYKEMKIAKRNYDVGYVLGFAGGALVGWPLGTAVAGGKPNWTLASIGAGLILVSIPCSATFAKHAKNAVAIYNSGLNRTGLRKIDFNVGVAHNSIGIKVIF